MNRRLILCLNPRLGTAFITLREENDIDFCVGLGDVESQCLFHRVAEILYYDPATQKQGRALISCCLRGDCDVWQSEYLKLSFIINFDESELF